MNDDTEEMIPVGGIGDWLKGKVRDLLLSYAKPFWDDIKAAVTDRDFGKLADVIDKIGELAGYPDVAHAVSAVFRELAAGNYLAALEKGIAAVKVIVALFPKSTETGPIRLMGTGDTFEAEVDALLNGVFPPATVAAGDGQPQEVGFGIIEIAAIASLVWTAIQAAAAWRKKRKEQPVVG